MTPTVPDVATPSRTTAPAMTATSAKQANSVHVNVLPVQKISWSGPATGSETQRLISLEISPAPTQWKDFCEQTPIDEARHSVNYSGCFEGIGRFPGEPYKVHLKPEHKPARHAPRKVPIHLEDAFKEEIKSLVELGILEEVKELADWVNSYVIVEKDSGNHHSPNHTIKGKLRICLDPRDLNEALEREPYHIRSVDEITAKLQGITVVTIVDFKIPGNSPVWHYHLADSNGQDCTWVQWLPRIFSNPSQIPSLLAWKVSQELLMTW